MKKINYVTIFPECAPIHLKKDVGMLPYSLGKYCEYNFSIVCYENQSFKKREIDNFHIITIPREHNVLLDFAKYIIKHAKAITILNLYHITSSRNILWVYLYKFLNPYGKVHMKLDADYRMINMINMSEKNLKGKFKKEFFNKMIDLYTIESEKMKTILEDNWGIKMKVIPNGIFKTKKSTPTKIIDKENIFLTVGRLGTEQKATEILLMAFEAIKDKCDWKLILVGNIEIKFFEYIKHYFIRNPGLRERVFFTGNIVNADELTKLYMRAKVFVLPSKWESFALVLLEALECGDYLILSNQIPSADEISKKGRYADIVEFGNVDQLAKTMLESTNRFMSNDEMKEMNQWIHTNYSWEIIAKKLNKYINEII